jgi:hypothetical protein
MTREPDDRVTEGEDPDVERGDRRQLASTGASTRQADDASARVGSQGPPTGAWRDETLRKSDELEALGRWMHRQQQPPRGADEHLSAIERHLARARLTATEPDRRSRWKRLISPADSSAVDAALGSIDAAEAGVLRVTPLELLGGQMPSVEAQVYRYLPKADPRRRDVEGLGHDSRNGQPLDDRARDRVVNAYHAAGTQRRRDLARVASFSSVLIVATIILCVAAILLAAGGVAWPNALPLCFHPEDEGKIVCPLGETPADENGAPLTGPTSGGDLDDGLRATVNRGDVVLVEVVGLLAAGLAVVTALRGLRGTSTPFRLPLALAMLKLPAGAVTAVLGLLFMRGGFVPGLTALDSSAQILAWAVVFGYAQQLFTGLVDQQAHGVLAGVGGRGASGERETSST